MTQFALITTNNDLDCLQPLDALNDEFLLNVAISLFPGISLNKIYLFDVGGMSVDDLIVDAQRAVLDNKNFQETHLYSGIKKIIDHADDFVFWYGSDYDDLEYASTAKELLEKLEIAVSDSFCEAYVHYKKP